MSARKRVKQVDATLVPSVGGSGSEDEEWLERGDHPLLNDLILETLFGFVRRFDLKACRVVCKRWNLHTLPHMRSHFKVTIHSRKSSFRNRRMGNFVRLFRSNELGIPFEKFKLMDFTTRDGVGQRFIEMCGEIATEIDMTWEVYRIEDVSELLKSCPNLKVFGSPHSVRTRSRNFNLFPDSTLTFPHLKNIYFRLNCEKRYKFCPTFIEELMRAAPNVAVIESSACDKYEEEENEDEEASSVSDVLNEIEEFGKHSSIQSLNLRYGGPEQIYHLKRMAKDGLKLRSLSFEPREREAREWRETDGDWELELDGVQIQLATIFRDSLQHLKVKQIADNMLMEYQTTPILKSLCVQVSPDTDPKPVNLNDNFPALEKLDIGFDDSQQEWNEFFSRFLPCPTLKTLRVGFGTLSIHGFQDIQRVFLNLTKLELEFKEDGEEILRRIWTQMTQLESLAIWGFIEITEGLELDSLITGIPIQTLKGLTPVMDELGRMDIHERREEILKLRNEYCRLPSVGNLTKLKHFELDVNGGGTANQRKQRCGGFSIGPSMTVREFYCSSDITGYLAFYSMNQLNHLKVKSCKFTKTCCEILTKETELEYWVFQNEHYDAIIPPFL